MQLIRPQKSVEKRGIYALEPLVLYPPDLRPVASERKLPPQIYFRLEDISARLRKPNARAKGTAFLAYIADLSGSQSGERLQTDAESNFPGISKSQRNEDFHDLCGHIAEGSFGSRIADRLKCGPLSFRPVSLRRHMRPIFVKLVPRYFHTAAKSSAEAAHKIRDRENAAGYALRASESSVRQFFLSVAVEKPLQHWLCNVKDVPYPKFSAALRQRIIQHPANEVKVGVRI